MEKLEVRRGQVTTWVSHGGVNTSPCTRFFGFLLDEPNSKGSQFNSIDLVYQIICTTLEVENGANQRPLGTWDREPATITLQALSLVEKAEPVQVRFPLCLRDQRSMWMQGGCKVYMDSYMASNGSCFVVTWIIFRNHLLEVSLTQNWETMWLWNVLKDWFCGCKWSKIETNFEHQDVYKTLR